MSNTDYTNKCKGLLRDIISQTEDIDDYEANKKIDRWLNQPISHFNGDTPNQVIARGQGRKVVGLLEQLAA